MAKKQKPPTPEPVLRLHGLDLSNDPLIPKTEIDPILDPITFGTPITITTDGADKEDPPPPPELINDSDDVDEITPLHQLRDEPTAYQRSIMTKRAPETPNFSCRQRTPPVLPHDSEESNKGNNF